jgi:esterase/lipase
MYADAQAAYSYLIDCGYSEGEIIVYGRSLGSGMAMEMAYRHHPKALILEAPFTSIEALAGIRYPILKSFFHLRYRFDNLKKIKVLKIPVLIFHGKKDKRIPFSESFMLDEAAGENSKLVLIDEADHNNCPSFAEYSKALSAFL